MKSLMNPQMRKQMSPPSNAPQHPAIEGYEYDLLIYGKELILRGSNQGTLVAVAAIALQSVRPKAEDVQSFGCAILVFSILMSALAHFCLGNADVVKAHKMVTKQAETAWETRFRGMNIAAAWIAGVLQFITLIVGILLVLPNDPPDFLARWFEG